MLQCRVRCPSGACCAAAAALVRGGRIVGFYTSFHICKVMLRVSALMLMPTELGIAIVKCLILLLRFLAHM